MVCVGPTFSTPAFLNPTSAFVFLAHQHTFLDFSRATFVFVCSPLLTVDNFSVQAFVYRHHTHTHTHTEMQMCSSKAISCI